MVNRLPGATVRRGSALRLAAGWAAAGVLLCSLPAALAQKDSAEAPKASNAGEKNSRSSRIVPQPSQPPAFQIAVGPLGFAAPGAIYLGQRRSLVSLDFLDESRLLFTFRAPGLIRREAGDGSDERQIRAVVLELPSGRVEVEALWTLHGRVRYLWMLNDGSFLLRDGAKLKRGDATLELKPYLRFPGPLLWLGTDPSQQLLVTGSEEPIAAREGKTASPVAVGAKTAGQKVQSEQTGLMLRILRRDSGQVMLVSHPRTAVHLSINSDGYLESLRTKGIEWLVNLRSFHGGNTPVGRLDSSCAPSYIFVSERELVATICDSHGGHRLVAMGIDGQRLWEALLSENEIWPRLTPSPDGSRLARETLTVSREVNASSPLTTEDVKGQLVEIYDAANGKIALTAPITPALDGGGNVALSPTGRRVAVLNAGFIQIFELPAPLLLPDISGNHSPH